MSESLVDMFDVTFDETFHSTDSTVAAASSSSSLEKFRKTETINMLERMAALDGNDLRKYFQGFRKLYDSLHEKKDEIEVDEIIYVENLKELRSGLADIRQAIADVRVNVETECSNIKSATAILMEEVEKRDPSLASRIAEIRSAQRQVAYLRFVKNFIETRDDVRRCLRARNYEQMMEYYAVLRTIPENSLEFTKACQREFKVRMESLNEFLAAELKSCLLELYGRIHFPFEDAIDLAALRKPLETSVEILRCIHVIGECDEITGGQHHEDALEIVLFEFGKRFRFHFYGDRETNRCSNPEWFFTQISDWLSKNLEYFEVHVQNFLNLIGSTRNARDEFIVYLVKLASEKIHSITRSSDFIHNRKLLSHLIDETVIFEKELADAYEYDENREVHAINELCAKHVLDAWFQLEHDTISAYIDEILIERDAYDSRYQGASDVDPYLVPNFADSFVLLMQSMFERYRSIPNEKMQCRFVVLQVLIVDEFQSRIVQISQQIDTPWRSPNPQLMNALWYLTLVLDDWSNMPEFIRLQFHLHASSNSLVHGVFDESAALYRHFWRQRANNMAQSFSQHIIEKARAYMNEKWYSENFSKPIDVTASFSSFLIEIEGLLEWINEHISPDSILSIYYLVNHEIWSALDHSIISQTSFSCRGAAQMLHDITSALIPLLNLLFSKSKSVADCDIVLSEKCIYVLNTLRVLALSTPTVILIKDEINDISDQTLAERLEPFSITSIDRTRLLAIFDQRSDLMY